MPRVKGALNRPAEVRAAAKLAAEQRRQVRAAYGLGTRGRFPTTVKVSDGTQIPLLVEAPRYDDPKFDTPITKARREAREARKAQGLATSATQAVATEVPATE